MTFKALGLGDKEEWDGLVSSFTDCDVYYLAGYARGFALHGDGEPLLLSYEDGATRAVSVVMKRDIADDSKFVGRIDKGVYFDFSTPYGYGGWLIEGEDLKGLEEEYLSFCRAEGIVSEFVRFHPVLGNASKVEEIYDVQRLGSTVALDLSSEDVIWRNITSKNRNMIRKAQKNGITIGYGNTTDLFAVFKAIYEETMDRDSAAPYYYFDQSMYDSIRIDLAGNAEVFFAEKDGEVIAASIVLFDHGRLSYHLSGSRTKYRSLAPSNLLLYEVARWGSENGFKTFHLGGGVGSQEDNLYKFKKSFYRGDPLRYAVGRRVLNEDAYRFLCGGGYPKEGFFPAYRI